MGGVEREKEVAGAREDVKNAAMFCERRRRRRWGRCWAMLELLLVMRDGTQRSRDAPVRMVARKRGVSTTFRKV
jgi:hypothetical protein